MCISDRLFRAICLILAVMCLIVALARPQWGFTWEEAKQRGLDIIVAIDTSKSMLAEDIAPNRLQRAKLAALDLMQQAKSDRLGLVAFAGGARREVATGGVFQSRQHALPAGRGGERPGCFARIVGDGDQGLSER